ncbi:hypothetical protein Enr13x_12680 [Stieleria neptunia]|uniref:Recombinase n=1 Tax=Stieleria neptunia TaxID=2527979 RepID=A0A518HKY3_9BACT|nr:recombinase family protein [Stieleria neptunia]QDV41429.1 hypothetical protein Enr13x_12680 [Stieleria neptunia]
MKIKKQGGQKRAAIYLRMSSSPQKDSISQQREACLLYASDTGYQIVGEYADEAISGVSSEHKRNGFQKLVTDAEAGQFEYVVCWSQSRASRSKPRQFVAEMNPLADAGVKLVFTDRGVVDMDDLPGFLMSTIDAHSNNDYVMKMAREVVRGQNDKRAAKGLWVAGRPPFGLATVKGGKIIVGDPDDAETIRLMFKWYAEGFSDRSIVHKLADERGVTKTQRFVQKVLTNPLYAGDYRWNANSSGRFFALRDGRVTKDFETGKNAEADVVFIPNNHEAIVDRELFTRVQMMRAERSTKTTPFRNGGEHLLTGLCRCSKCGQKFTGHRYKGKNGNPDRLTLSCNGYRQGTCQANYVNQRDVVASVVASFDQLIDQDKADALREAYADSLRDDRPSVNVKALRASLATAQADYDNLRGKLAKLPDDLLADFTDDLRKKKAQIEKLQSRIDAASVPEVDQLSRFDEQLDMLGDVVGELKAAIAEIADTEPRLVRNLLATICESIKLDVTDRGKGKSPRFELIDGEITVKPGFNLIPAS